MPGVKIVWVMKVKAVLVLLVLQSQGGISLLQLLKLREKGVSLFELLLSALDSRHAVTIGTDFLRIDHFEKVLLRVQASELVGEGWLVGGRVVL